MVNDEFVDLDDIVPGTGFRKRPDEQPLKKEIKQDIKQDIKSKLQESASNSQEKSVEQKQSKPEKQDAQKIVDSSEEEIEEIDVKEEQTEESVEKIQKQNKPASQKEMSKVMEEKKKESKSELKESRDEVKKKPIHTPEKNVSKFSKMIPVKKSVQKTSQKSALTETSKKNKIEAKSTKNFAKSSKKSARKSEEKETNWTLVALLILGAIIVGVIIYMALKLDFSGSDQESVVAVVNGQPIYKSEIANRYNLLKNTMNTLISEEQVLNLTITDKLLLQEAEKRGIRTSDEEVNILLNEIMTQNNIDETALKQDLESKNVSYDFLFDLYRNTLTINKLINESFGNINLSDEEISAFYDANKESLKIPDMVQVRHILFIYGPSENETYKNANKVLELIKSDKSNFCALVLTYTEDAGSKETCGEYNFSADYPFVPEFIDAGLSMKPGDIKIIKTQIGYHIMYKVANLPGYVPKLKDVKDKLVPVLVEEKTLQELQLLISDLQDKAIIEIYSESVSTKKFKEVTANNIPVIEENVAEIRASEEAQETIDEVAQEVLQTEETTAEPIVDVTQEQSTGTQETTITKEVVITSGSKKFILATCLADKGDRMFTASWSPDSQTQLDLFEEYSSNLVVVECDPDSKNANLAECSKVLKKQYPTWPTWQINGALYEGIQSLTALSRYSNCPY